MGACLTKECKKNKNGYLQAGKRKQTVKELERFPCWIGSFPVMEGDLVQFESSISFNTTMKIAYRIQYKTNPIDKIKNKQNQLNTPDKK